MTTSESSRNGPETRLGQLSSGGPFSITTGEWPFVTIVVAVVAACCTALILLPKDREDFVWQPCVASHPAWDQPAAGGGLRRAHPALVSLADERAYLLLPPPKPPGDKDLWRSRSGEFEVTAASGPLRKPLHIWFEDELWEPHH